jgi:hypothetical protein
MLIDDERCKKLATEQDSAIEPRTNVIPNIHDHIPPFSGSPTSCIVLCWRPLLFTRARVLFAFLSSILGRDHLGRLGIMSEFIYLSTLLSILIMERRTRHRPSHMCIMCIITSRFRHPLCSSPSVIPNLIVVAILSLRAFLQRRVDD